MSLKVQAYFSNVHELSGEPNPAITGKSDPGAAVQSLRFRRVGTTDILAGEAYLEFRARVEDASGGYTDPLPRRYTLTGLQKDRRYLAEELESHHGPTEIDIDFALQLRDNVNAAGEIIDGVRITLTATQTNQDNPPVYGILRLEYGRPVSNADVDERIRQEVSVWAHTDDERPIPPEKLVTAHKAIPIPGNPTAADLNDIGPGIFLFTNSLPVLGIPIGTWLLTSNQNEDGSVDLYQEAKRLGGGDEVTYTRRKLTGTWVNADVFALQEMGGVGTGEGLNELQVDNRIATWARASNQGGTADIPDGAISDNIARLAQVEDWAEVGNNTQIPANKLENAPAGGLSESEVDARTVTGGNVVGTTLTLTKTGGENVVITGLPTSGSGSGISETTARGLIADWAETSNTDIIPPEKTDVVAWALNNNPDIIPSEKLPPVPEAGLNQAAVDERIRIGVSDWAEAGNQADVPDGKISDTIARTNQLANFVTGSDVSTAITESVEDWARDDSTAIPEGKLSNAPGLNQQEVDGRIVIWAREGNSDIIPPEKTDVVAWALNGNDTDIPESKIPDTIARDDEIEIWAKDPTTPIPAEKLTNAPSGGGLDQAAVDLRVGAGVADWAETGNTDTIPAEKLPPDTSGPVNIMDHYVHIGTPDLSGTVSGVTGSTDITPPNTNEIRNVDIRFDDTLNGFNIPTAGSYNTPENGDILLPAGHWIICASLNVVSTAGGNSRVAAVLSINHGTNQRHAQALYLRNDESQIGADGISQVQGKVSVTGAVISDGLNPIRIRIAVVRQGASTINIRGAHIHGYQQLLGRSRAEGGEGNAFVITTIQADSASINGAEAGAFSFTIPANTTRLGLPTGHYFMRAYEWDVSGNDAIQEAIGIGSGIHYTRTNSTGEWETTDLFTANSGGSNSGSGDISAAFTHTLIDDPTADNIDAAENGTFEFTLATTELGLPTGRYLMRAYVRAPSNVAVQDVIDVSTRTRYTRTSVGGSWSGTPFTNDVRSGFLATNGLVPSTAAGINNADIGFFYVNLTSTTLGLPAGQYAIQGFRVANIGNISQQAYRMSDGTRYIRRRIGGSWTNSNVFEVEGGGQWSANLLNGTFGRTVITSTSTTFVATRTLPEMNGARAVLVEAAQVFASGFAHLVSNVIISRGSDLNSHRIENAFVAATFSFPSATQIRADSLGAFTQIIGVYVYK